MAIEVNLRDIQSGFLTATAFTQNNTLIEEAFSKAINREGGASNSMQADLDMGLNNIINADNLDVNSITIDGTDYEAVVEAHRIAAANSAAAALASEQAASNSEQAAALSEQNAASSEQNAAADEQATAQYLAQFSTQYLGSLEEEPTTDQYGDPIKAGAMYWNTPESVMYIYTGTVWGTTEQAFLDALQYAFDQDQIARSDAFDQAQQDRSDTFDLSEQSREDTFVLSQQDKEDRFNTFITSSGYAFLGAYAASITINEYNEVVQDVNGEFWRVSGTTALPYTTDGTGLPEGGAFVAVGDAALRQELASSTGGSLIGYNATTLDLAVADNTQAITDHVNSTTSHEASSVTYDNTVSELSATEVQAAIDELASKGSAYPQVVFNTGYLYRDSGTNLPLEVTLPLDLQEDDLIVVAISNRSSLVVPTGYTVVNQEYSLETTVEEVSVLTKTAVSGDAGAVISLDDSGDTILRGMVFVVRGSAPLEVLHKTTVKGQKYYYDGVYNSTAYKVEDENSIAFCLFTRVYVSSSSYAHLYPVCEGRSLLDMSNNTDNTRIGALYKEVKPHEYVLSYWRDTENVGSSYSEDGINSIFIIREIP